MTGLQTLWALDSWHCYDLTGVSRSENGPGARGLQDRQSAHLVIGGLFVCATGCKDSICHNSIKYCEQILDSSIALFVPCAQIAHGSVHNVFFTAVSV